MGNAKRLGMSPHIYCLPLIEGLRQDAAFELFIDATTKNAIELRERELDAAFLSPIDYAREGSAYNIVPTIAVSSRQANDTVVLHFREGLRNITSVAVDPASTSEIVLARILLAERFDVEPKIVPATGSLHQMLLKADAALVVGDAALSVSRTHPNKLDLIEEWNDLLDLPYVYGFWCGKEDALSYSEIQRILQARDSGVQAMERISADSLSRFSHFGSVDSIHSYLQMFSYEFTEDVRAGLSEFLRYAYYYGVLPDVADLNFYPTDDSDATRASGFRLN